MPCKLRVQIESEFGAVDLYHGMSVRITVGGDCCGGELGLLFEPSKIVMPTGFYDQPHMIFSCKINTLLDIVDTSCIDHVDRITFPATRRWKVRYARFVVPIAPSATYGICRVIVDIRPVVLYCNAGSAIVGRLAGVANSPRRWRLEQST